VRMGGDFGTAPGAGIAKFAPRRPGERAPVAPVGDP